MELVRQKNVATIIVFPIVDADGDLVTGASGLDSEIDTWADGSAPDGFADCTNEATEIGSTGMYYLSLTQSEMNADYIIIQVKTSTSGAKTQVILIRTMVGDPLNLATTDDGGAINVASGVVESNVVQVSGDSGAADNLESYCDGTTPQPVNVTQIGGTAQSATDLKDFADTGYDPTTHKVQGVVLTDTCTTNTDMRGTDNAYTGTPPTVTAIRQEMDTNSTQLAALVTGVHVTSIGEAVIDSNAVASDISNEITEGVWDVPRSWHTISGSFGEGVSSVQGNVTGNVAGSVNSVTSDVNVAELGPGVIVSTSLDAGAITAIQNGLSTHSAADVVTAIEADGSKLDHLWETTEDDSGVRRFTTNALEQASGTGATAQQVWEYANRTVTNTPDVNVTQIQGHALAGTGTQIADGFEHFFDVATPAKTLNDCGVEGSGLSAEDVWTYTTRVLTANTNLGIPSAADNADAVWDEAIADHTTGTTFGGKNQRVVPSETLNDYKADVSGLATSAALATVDGIVDSILEDTNELQTNQGNWLTATGFSTHSAADVWSVTTRALTDKAGFTISGTKTTLDALNDISSGDVSTACGTALTSYDPPTATEMASAFTEIKGATWSSATDTLEHIRDKQSDIETDTQDLQTQIGTNGAGLTNIPWNSAWDAEVQSECADALNAYDPPTNTEMEARTIAAADYATASALGTVDTVVDAIKVTTDKLDDTLELDTDVYRFTENALEQAPSGTGASAASIADAVWDEILSGHSDVGSTGAALAAAGGSGDPWATALPGSYGAGTAGKIIGDNLNATVGSRATQTSVDTIDGIVDSILEDTGTTLPGTLTTMSGYIDTEVAAILAAVDTEVAAIKAKTDNLPADPTGQSAVEAAITAAHATTDGKIDAVDDYVDTEIAAIKAVTDKLDTAVELDGAVYRLTANALELAPVDGAAPTVAAIRAEIDANSTQLAAIKTKTDGLNFTGTDVKATLDGETVTVGTNNDKTGYALTVAYDAAKTAASQSSVDTIDGIVDAILEDTGTTLPASLSAISAYIDTEVAAILEDTGSTIPGLIGALNLISVDDVLDEAVEGTVTLRQALRGIMSVLMAKASGGGTSTLVYRDLADTKARVTVTADENGNRSAVVRDLT